MKENSGWSFTAEIIKTLVIVGLLAYVIRGFLLQPFLVQGSSMLPGFENHDYLIVNKFGYHVHPLQRGDVVVFRYPNDTSVNYIKRVIGLPGEEVKLVGGKVMVINQQHPEGVILDEPYVNQGEATLPTIPGHDDFVIPTGDYFVLGDNRIASSDSREWGFLPENDVIGKVLVQLYPLSRFHFTPHADYSF